MKRRLSGLLAIIVGTAWVSLSEFLRNEYLYKEKWTLHYEALGLEFPATPVNGAIWGLWSLFLVIFLCNLLRHMPVRTAVFWAWWASFLMMWLVVGNLSVLPFSILWLAVPWSILEVAIAAWIIRKFKDNEED